MERRVLRKHLNVKTNVLAFPIKSWSGRAELGSTGVTLLPKISEQYLDLSQKFVFWKIFINQVLPLKNSFHPP